MILALQVLLTGIFLLFAIPATMWILFRCIEAVVDLGLIVKRMFK